MHKIRIYFSVPLLFILSLTFVASNCKKPEPEPVKPTEEQLISKEWKVKRVTINNVQDESTNYSSYRRKFDTDGTYKFTDAPGVTKRGKWKLTSNKQRLILDEDTDEEQVMVILNDIEEDELDLEVTIPADYKHEERKAVYELVQ